MAKAESNFTAPIIGAATLVAKQVKARAFFAYANAVEDPQALQSAVKPPTQLILVCRDKQEEDLAKEVTESTLRVPSFDLTRMGQIKMATLIAFTQQMLSTGDVFVFLAGAAGQFVDTIVTMRVGREYDLFQTAGQPKISEHIRRPVFERVLRLALELAHEGREGKPIGTIMVLGDYREVLKYCQEGRINPFKGYAEKERNVLDDTIGETVKEIAKLDGAFILKGNGVIVSACTILRPAMAGDSFSQGMGARHAAAAAISASTNCVSISLSESTGDVRVWRHGQMITEIEKAARSPLDSARPN